MPLFFVSGTVSFARFIIVPSSIGAVSWTASNRLFYFLKRYNIPATRIDACGTVRAERLQLQRVNPRESTAVQYKRGVSAYR